MPESNLYAAFLDLQDRWIQLLEPGEAKHKGAVCGESLETTKSLGIGI